MSKKAVIIISNKEKHQIPLYVSNCDNNHLESFREFICYSGINYQLSERNNSQEIAFFLGELGYTVMLYDYDDKIKENILVVFLPKELSQNQYEWFQKRKEGLKNYNIMILENTSNNKWNPIDNTITEEPIISELDKIITKRLIRK